MVARVLADYRAGAPPFATLEECAAAARLIDAIYAAAGAASAPGDRP
jgi:hypothetical protein